MIIRKLSTFPSPLLLLLLVLLPLASLVEASGVLAIDYGTESMKVSLVKPGLPFDVLLNRDSKRKIQSVVAIRGEDRVFGADAANLAGRFPRDSFAAVKLLLGHSPKDYPAQKHSDIFKLEFSETDRGTISIKTPGGSQYLAEELLAMQFAYAKGLAEAAAQEQIQDVVVTVPVFFTQFERQAVTDAIELAGLKCLALINDGSAVAINYAMTRTFPTPENHVFYDAGAGSIRATLASFRTHEVKEHPASKLMKNVTSVEILGAGWDRTVGGLELDHRLRSILKDAFVKDHGGKLSVEIEKNDRAMNKLLREAARVKAVLSLNTESTSRIEGLAEDIDFRSQVTREEFETACDDLKEKYAQPLITAISAAKLTVSDISSVVLVGGASRTPMIQAAVKSVVGEDKIAQNVNADEAAVMGAALYGAVTSRQFKTKEVRLTDITPYDIDMAYEADTKSDETTPRTLKSIIYPSFSKTAVKKTVTVKKTADFPLHFTYKGPNDAPADILDVQITGLSAAFANLTEQEVQNATVKLSIQMSESGILSVPAASVFIQSKPSAATVASRLKGFFGGSKETKEGEEGDEALTDDAAAEAEANAPVNPVNTTKPLAVTPKHLGVAPLSLVDRIDSKKKLREIDLAETRKRVREEARNVLESYIYRLRDLLENDRFIAASIPGERQKIQKAVEETSEWLWDGGETAPTKDLKAKKSDLEKLARPIESRIEEALGRPAALDQFQLALMKAEMFLQKAQQSATAAQAADEPARHTPEELASFSKMIDDNKKWQEHYRTKVGNLPLSDDPPVKIQDFNRKTKDLQTEQNRLERKKAPRAKPVKSSSSASASSSSATTEPTSSPTTEDAAEPTEASADAGAGPTDGSEEEQRVRDEL